MIHHCTRSLCHQHPGCLYFSVNRHTLFPMVHVQAMENIFCFFFQPCSLLCPPFGCTFCCLNKQTKSRISFSQHLLLLLFFHCAVLDSYIQKCIHLSHKTSHFKMSRYYQIVELMQLEHYFHILVCMRERERKHKMYFLNNFLKSVRISSNSFLMSTLSCTFSFRVFFF